jgi:hypothetical protein
MFSLQVEIAVAATNKNVGDNHFSPDGSLLAGGLSHQF